MSDEMFDKLTKKTVSRRDFLKVAGVAGAAVGAGAGLGGLLAACGTTATTTTTTAGATTTTAGRHHHYRRRHHHFGVRRRWRRATRSRWASSLPSPARLLRSGSPTSTAPIAGGRPAGTASSAATARNTPSPSR